MSKATDDEIEWGINKVRCIIGAKEKTGLIAVANKLLKEDFAMTIGPDL